MKPKIAALMALVLAGFSPVANAALEFCGYTIVANEARFSLQDSVDQTSSPWISVGKAFRGYTIVAFDAEKELLSLKSSEGTTLQLSLRPAPIKEARTRISGSIKVGVGESVQVSKATLVLGEETRFDLKNGLSLRITPSAFAGNAIKYDAIFEKQESDGAMKKLASPAIIALPGKAFEVQVGDLGFAFEP